MDGWLRLPRRLTWTFSYPFVSYIFLSFYIIFYWFDLIWLRRIYIEIQSNRDMPLHCTADVAGQARSIWGNVNAEWRLYWEVAYNDTEQAKLGRLPRIVNGSICKSSFHYHFPFHLDTSFVPFQLLCSPLYLLGSTRSFVAKVAPHDITVSVLSAQIQGFTLVTWPSDVASRPATRASHHDQDSITTLVYTVHRLCRKYPLNRLACLLTTQLH
jgi:hypothetical protein